MAVYRNNYWVMANSVEYITVRKHHGKSQTLDILPPELLNKETVAKPAIMEDQTNDLLKEWLEMVDDPGNKNTSEKLDYLTHMVGVVLRLLSEIKTENREQINIWKAEVMSAKAEPSELGKEMTDLKKNYKTFKIMLLNWSLSQDVTTFSWMV